MLFVFILILSLGFYFFRLQKIEINFSGKEGNSLESIFVKQAYKNKVKLLLKPYMGQSLLLISFAKIFKTLEKENIFLDLSFFKQFPNTLKINFNLNPKFLLYLNNKGELSKILSNGKILKISSRQKYLLPILREDLPKKKKELKEFFVFVFKLLDFKKFSNKVSTIHYISNKEVHLFLEKPYIQIKLNWSEINLSKADFFSAHVQKIIKVLKYLQQHSYKAKTMDARFSNKIFVSYD